MLRTFLWDNMSQRSSLDTQYLNDRHLGKDDPAGVDKVVAAIQSRRHGRLNLNRDTWHLAERVDVSINTMCCTCTGSRLGISRRRQTLEHCRVADCTGRYI